MLVALWNALTMMNYQPCSGKWNAVESVELKGFRLMMRA
jgi:hypothetical protein